MTYFLLTHYLGIFRLSQIKNKVLTKLYKQQICSFWYSAFLSLFYTKFVKYYNKLDYFITKFSFHRFLIDKNSFCRPWKSKGLLE